MSHIEPTPIVPPLARNEVLQTLSSADFSSIRRHLTRVHLVQGQILHEAGERIEQAYFVEQGIVSMMAEVDNAGSIEPGMTEIGMVGHEGLVGINVLLQANAPSYSRSGVQIAGTALRIPAPVLRDFAASTPALRSSLHWVLQVMMSTVAQTAVCNSHHSLPKRLARWLLMAHDKVDGDVLPLTQEFLSIMLGVRRSGVTVAAGALERAGMIRHSRGFITIADRDGLERASCGCYARVRDFTHRLPRPDRHLLHG